MFVWEPGSVDLRMVFNLLFCFYFTGPEKTTFKIFYKSSPTEFQTLKFESETKVADEVVRKIKYVMRMRHGSARDEYYAFKDSTATKKLTRRFSVHSITGK